MALAAASWSCWGVPDARGASRDSADAATAPGSCWPATPRGQPRPLAVPATARRAALGAAPAGLHPAWRCEPASARAKTGAVLRHPHGRPCVAGSGRLLGCQSRDQAARRDPACQRQSSRSHPCIRVVGGFRPAGLSTGEPPQPSRGQPHQRQRLEVVASRGVMDSVTIEPNPMTERGVPGGEARQPAPRGERRRSRGGRRVDRTRRPPCAEPAWRCVDGASVLVTASCRWRAGPRRPSRRVRPCRPRPTCRTSAGRRPSCCRPRPRP